MSVTRKQRKFNGWLIGLTGGLGCGKSAAAAIFREFGVLSIDSDTLVHDLLNSDREVAKAIRGRFGSDLLVPPDGVNRSHLAEVVFRSPAELEWLEGLLHPRVRGAWQSWAALHEGRTRIVEIPLLFEKKLEKYFELTVCVSAGPRQQLSRLTSRGLSEEQIRARSSRQLPLEEKIRSADFVLSNSGSLNSVRKQILLLNRGLNLF